MIGADAQNVFAEKFVNDVLDVFETLRLMLLVDLSNEAEDIMEIFELPPIEDERKAKATGLMGRLFYPYHESKRADAMKAL